MTDRVTGGPAAWRAAQDAAWREADLMFRRLRREVPGLRVPYFLARQNCHVLENSRVAEAMAEELAGLAEALTARGYRAALIGRGGRWRPSLVVSHGEQALRTSEIIVESGWYWWPGARRVCAAGDTARAAGLIVHVLHPRCDCN